MSTIETYRDLIVWQRSMELVTLVYQETRAFPKEELYGLTSQVRRCAVSIPSNIAEGHGRLTRADYIRFLGIATGSLFELQTQLQIAVNLGYLTEKNYQRSEAVSLEVERMLSSLIRKLNVKK